MSRVVIVGDSLGLPTGVALSGSADVLEYENTYPYLLKQMLTDVEVISTCKRSNRTDKQAQEQWLCDDILFFKPHIVVIHLGICDCAPRLFNKAESFVLSRIPYDAVRDRIIAFFKKRSLFFTKKFKKVYVQKQHFECCLEKIINRVRAIQALPILVGIADTSDENKEKYYNYESNIRSYNHIIQRLAHKYTLPFIDMFQYRSDVLLQDGIHLNEIGSRYVAKSIAGIIEKRETEKCRISPENCV